MRLKLITFGILIGINGFSQTLDELEWQLRNTPILQLDSVKIICDRIFEIDKYNESAVYYLTESYGYQSDDSPEMLFFSGLEKSQIDTTINYNDSIKFFFDNLIQNDKLNPQPYIIKAKFQYLRTSPGDSNKIELLEKAVSLDKNNVEANYLLGQAYYFIFQKTINENSHNPDLKTIAEKSFNRLEQAFLLDSLIGVSIKYPLIQLANYLEKLDKVRLFENYPNSSDLYFPVLMFGEIPDNWRTNYKVNLMSEIDLALFVVNWYSDHLKVMNEPIIYTNYESDKVFRFTWLRTFDNPIAIRIENKNDKIILTWKECDGAGGYESGKLVVDR